MPTPRQPLDDRQLAHSMGLIFDQVLNPHRGLEGEQIDSDDMDEVQHWIAVYSELVGFKKRVLETVYTSLDGLGPAAQKELRGLDVTLLVAQKGRYERRLAFWERRARDIGVGQSP